METQSPELLSVVIDCNLRRCENVRDLVKGLEEVSNLPPFIKPVTDRGVRVTGDEQRNMRITYKIWDTHRNPNENDSLKAIVNSKHKCFVYDPQRGLIETETELNYQN